MGLAVRIEAPAAPSIAALAKALGMTEEHLRYLARRYQYYVTGK
jgi:hypothetical protein